MYLSVAGTSKIPVGVSMIDEKLKLLHGILVKGVLIRPEHIFEHSPEAVCNVTDWRRPPATTVIAPLCFELVRFPTRSSELWWLSEEW
jgi:hypothetical protein